MTFYQRHIQSCPSCSGNLQLFYKDIHEDVWNALSENERDLYKEIIDPLYWASKNLYLEEGGYTPRVANANVVDLIEQHPEIVRSYGKHWERFKQELLSTKEYSYQEKIIRCTSSRIVARAGRRLGKSNSIVVKILHKLITNDNFKVVLVTPSIDLLTLIIGEAQGSGMIREMLNGNPDLLSQIKRHVQSPHPKIEFTNGSFIVGFVSGSVALRGQDADLIWLDEASFLTKADIAPVLGYLSSKPGIPLYLTSTPQGQLDYFKEKTEDPNYISFYYPGMFNPLWHQIDEESGRTLEQILRDEIDTEADFNREVFALFDSAEDGVFQQKFIDIAYDNEEVSENYSYNPNWKYIVGVDWNSERHGTRIFVVGTPDFEKFYVVHHSVVSVKNWTQTMAIQKIIDINREWHPHGIYVDSGYGHTAIENIQMFSLASSNAADRKLLNILKPVELGKTIEIIDPFTKTKVPKPLKGFMVNNAVRFFEKSQIVIPKEFTKLKQQLENYKIRNKTEKGVMTYGPPKGLEVSIGDHDLDTLMFALLGFTMEFSKLVKPQVALLARTLEHISKIRLESDESKVPKVQKPPSREMVLKDDRERKETEYEEALKKTENINTTNRISGLDMRHIKMGMRPKRSTF